MNLVKVLRCALSPFGRPFPHRGPTFVPFVTVLRRFKSEVQFYMDTKHQLIPSDNEQQIQLLFLQFPLDEIRYSFGYGSGVFQQAGYNESKPQIDMVHIVDNPVKFHRLNSERYPGHYSGLLCLGISAVMAVQNLGAGVYFNPYVPMKDCEGNEKMVKYGVISTESALKDIQEWTTLYIAGRLQKPVKFLHGDSTIRRANESNLQNAFNLALLLLSRNRKKGSIPLTSIYEKVALLSYMGDPRMVVGGENPNKVKNIVSKQREEFHMLYRPYFEETLSKSILVCVGDEYEIRLNNDSVAQILSSLPLQFRRRLLNSYRNMYKSQLLQDTIASEVLSGKTDEMDIGPYLRKILEDRGLKRALKASLLATIAYPALVQTLKGLFTAGIIKSTKYAWEKKRKSWAK